jgi:hypothetical protein
VKGLFRYVITVLAGWVLGVVVAVQVFVLGLIVPMTVIWPLMLAVAALVAALCAGWTGNLLARDGMRTHLLAVLGFSEAVALLLAVLSALLVLTPTGEAALFGGPASYRVALVVAIIALAAGAATRRYRDTERRRDGMLTLVLVLLILPVVFGVISVSCSLFVRCGA